MMKQIIRLGELDLECHEFGDGEPLLLLHGGRGFFPDEEAMALLSAGRRLIVPSHPGFGNSSLPDWLDSVTDIAHVHLGLLDSLGIHRIDVVGCSIGGWIAAEIGAMAPERIKRLVMAAPVGVKVGSVDRLDVPDIFAMSQGDLAELLHHDPKAAHRDPADLSDEQLRIMLRNRETLTLISWEPYMHNPKLKHLLHRLHAPTLFLRGSSDGFVSADYLEAYARLLPNASTETLPDVGHDLLGERPAGFVARVKAFLSEVTQPQAKLENA